ncbi:HNH endonuclease [Actinosynnema sp. NPDC004786]
MTTLAELRARLAEPPTSPRFVTRDAAVLALGALLDLPAPAAPGLAAEDQALVADGWSTCHHTVVTTVDRVLDSRPATHRGTTNRDVRGSSHDRAARRAWLVETYGDGSTVLCYRCRTSLTVSTVTSDRIIPGSQGGTYRRDNIRPMCGTCNSITGGQLSAATRRDAPPAGPVLSPVLARMAAAVRCHPSGVMFYGPKQAGLVAELELHGLVTVERRINDLVVRPACEGGLA